MEKREAFEQQLAGHQPQDGVAQKLKLLVVLFLSVYAFAPRGLGLLVSMGAVRERALQQLGALEFMPQRSLQGREIVFTHKAANLATTLLGFRSPDHPITRSPDHSIARQAQALSHKLRVP